VFDLDGIPVFNQDEERSPPRQVAELKQRIRGADAILLATPEYNYGMSGALKNAIDWASRPYGDNAWDGKPCAIMSAAMSMGGGVRAQYQLRQAFVFLNMEAVLQPEVAIGNATQRFDEQGNLKDETSKKLIAQLLQNLVKKVRLHRPEMKAAA
jgi:chromate reductase